MKNSFLLLIFFAVLFCVIYTIAFILEYTYNNCNIWLTLFINIGLLISFVYFIDKFVKKLDKND